MRACETVLLPVETNVIYRMCMILAFCWMMPIQAQADLIIQVLDSNIAVNGTGVINVVIRSKVGDTHNVSLVGYDFSIANIGAPVGSLEFLAVQSTTEQADANYVFKDFQPTGNFSYAVNSPVSYTGGDFTNTPAPPFAASTVTSSNQLLVRLDVKHVLPANTNPTAANGSTFSISLNDALSQFQDENGNPITFTSIAGTATITAVPEPSSFLAVVLAGAGWHVLRRRKSAR